MEVNWCSEFAGDEGRQGGQLKREPGKRASVISSARLFTINSSDAAAYLSAKLLDFGHFLD